MEREHSLLNPSSAEIWLTCTRAPRFAAKFEKKQSDYADEGTLCHAIATDELNYRLKRLSKKEYLKRLGVSKQHRLYDKEMDGYAEGFVDYVLSIYETYLLKGWADIWVEEKIDYDHIAPDGYGHLDVAILSPKTIDVIDYKYGKGVAKSAIANPQLGLYAIGVIRAAQFIDEFEKVNLHIYQPRIDNISTYTNTVKEYTRWGETTVKKAATLAWKGEGDFRAGVHCRFCAAQPKCQEAANRHKALAEFDFKLPYEMDNDDVAEVLAIGESLLHWYTSVKEYATQEARKGAKFPGFKLVAGKSMRKFADGKEALIKKALINAGYTGSDFTKTQLVGFGELEKLLGKDGIDKIIGKFIIKPAGLPTLVPETDKRKAIHGTEGAQNDFKHLID